MIEDLGALKQVSTLCSEAYHNNMKDNHTFTNKQNPEHDVTEYVCILFLFLFGYIVSIYFYCSYLFPF
jgi:phosphate starvation-inducible membrane PsiE